MIHHVIVFIVRWIVCRVQLEYEQHSKIWAEFQPTAVNVEVFSVNKYLPKEIKKYYSSCFSFCYCTLDCVSCSVGVRAA